MNEAITAFSADVTAAVLGESQEFIKGCCGIVDERLLTPDQIEAGISIELIIQLIMMLIENCKDKETFTEHVKKQTRFARGYFAILVRMNSPRELRFRGRLIPPRSIAHTTLSMAANLPDTVINTIWDEVKNPAWT
jgi:hypothetical protein